MNSIRRAAVVSTILVLCAMHGGSASAKEKLPPTLSKGYRILIENGLQIQGMASADDPFHLETYAALNYSAINWFNNSSSSEPRNFPSFCASISRIWFSLTSPWFMSA